MVEGDQKRFEPLTTILFETNAEFKCGSDVKLKFETPMVVWDKLDIETLYKKDDTHNCLSFDIVKIKRPGPITILGEEITNIEF